MRDILLAVLAICVGYGHSLPTVEDSVSCDTETLVFVQPTLTKTLETTHVVTVTASTAKDLGTFTWVERVSDTTTLPETLTNTVASCTSEGIVTPAETITVYTSEVGAEPFLNAKIAQQLNTSAPTSCTVISTRTTLYGSAFTYVTNGKTSTYTKYAGFSLATVTSTSTGGIAYAIATAVTTRGIVCGPTASMDPSERPTVTITRDSRCAPSAIVSAYNSYGLSWLSDHPGYPGATFNTNASDAGECCQICAEAYRCSNSAWDVRTNRCRLEFVVWPYGEQSCDNEKGGLLAYYGYGPIHPMPPGSGWWIGSICGKAHFAGAKPDDGS